MTITRELIDKRIAKHRANMKMQKDLENPKKRHSAWKQLHGRIKELQYLKRFAEVLEDENA